jgi:putative transposase
MIFRLDRAYKNFFDKISGFPKFQSETDTISFVKTDVRVVNEQLFLPKIKNMIKVKEDIPVNYTSVKLHREDGMWFLIFAVKEERTSTPDNSDILGIDLGLKDLYTTSEGEKGGRLSQKLIKKYHYRTKYLNQSLSKKTKGSRRFKKVKKHLKRAYTRLKNTKNDYLHKQANRLLDCTEGIIALGNIDVQSIVTDKRTSKGLIKSFYINSLGIFKQYVTYKATRQNKTVIPIDEKNTSKTCSCCGNIKHDLKLGDRVYNCRTCNNSIDRDVNAAVNMKLLGSSSLSERTDSSIT